MFHPGISEALSSVGAQKCAALNAEEREAAGTDTRPSEYTAPNPTFNDMTDDALSCILSFLSPLDVSACACVNRRLRELCSEEGKVWLPMCERRWGKCTNLTHWGQGLISFKLLHGTLVRWEHLIGFWRGVGNGGWGSLALFDWGPHYIVGHKVIPAGSDSYGVRKVPFLWMGISDEGQVVCLIDPSFKAAIKASDSGAGASGGWDCPGGARSCASPSGVREILPETSMFCKIFSPDLDVEKLNSLGLAMVEVNFVGNCHIVIEEIPQRCAFGKNELAEAAALASFGSSCSLAELGRAGRSSYSSGSESESYARSPPGSFQHEMYQFLAGKMTSPGSYRAARKQRRRDKERALSLGRCLVEPEHFVKVLNCCPTKTRPLQGLWKGIFESVGLDFVLVSYDEQGGIVCRKIHELYGVPKIGSVFWTSKSTSRIGLPLPSNEQALYDSKPHFRPILSPEKNGETKHCARFVIETGELVGEEVIGVLLTSCDFHARFSPNKREGRVWQYASGNFGFGFVDTNCIIDFRLLCSEDCLVDVI